MEHEDLAEKAQALIRTRPRWTTSWTNFTLARDYFDAMVVDLIRREYLDPEATMTQPT